MTIRHPYITILATLFTTLFCLGACESAPPIQEMSDARQAIAVAREAGAADTASPEFRAAEQSLERAEMRLNERNYAQAREDAMFARERAQAALIRAENTTRSP